MYSNDRFTEVAGRQAMVTTETVQVAYSETSNIQLEGSGLCKMACMYEKVFSHIVY